MIYCVILQFGYMEDQRIGFQAYTAQSSAFSAKFEALRDLSRYFFDKYKEEVLDEQSPRGCKECQKYRENKEFERCPKCGDMLRVPSFDPEAFVDWLRLLGGATIDDYGSYQDANWTPYSAWEDIRSLEPDGVFVVQANAERVIALALDPNCLDEDNRKPLDEYRKSWLDRQKERAGWDKKTKEEIAAMSMDDELLRKVEEGEAIF